jgi:Family of unknown function (DUF5519)
MSVAADYRGWRALGPGGLPYNVLGWAIASALRPLKREPLSTRLYDHCAVPPAWDRMRQGALPRRQGTRPHVAHYPIPHRQVAQLASDDVIEQTSAWIRSLPVEEPGALPLGRSVFERRGEALFCARPAQAAPWLQASRGEIAHVHPHDGSLHVVLHPQDAVAVIEAGWGERHPLCGVPLLGIPLTYLLVYAPRNAEELAVVSEIVRRASAFAG